MQLERKEESGSLRTRRERLKQQIKHEAREWAVMFAYLWLLFGLFGLHQSIIMSQQHLDFRMQGFAVINALILSKVMLVGEGLQFAQGRPEARPIVTILKKSLAFALLFMAFHVLESIVVGLAHGKQLAESFPALAGGGFRGIVSLGVIVSVSLIPFFAIRELSRDLGKGQLSRLLLEPRARAE